jgi:hypothetical protein
MPYDWPRLVKGTGGVADAVRREVAALAREPRKLLPTGSLPSGYVGGLLRCHS